MSEHSIREAERTVPVRGQADVLVVGAGPSGIAAALAAAEDGLKVCLVERHGFVGGNLTIGLPVLGFLSQKGEQIIAGLPQRIIDRLRAANAASQHQACPLHMSFTLIEPQAVQTVILDMLRDSGVDPLLHSLCAGVIMEGDRLRGIVTESKAGCEAILAKVTIDCTGDGDVAFRAGVSCDKGDAHGGMQPATLMFSMAGVDTEKLRLGICNEPDTYTTDHIPADYYCRHRRFIVVGLRQLIQKARGSGLSIATDRTILITGLREGEVWVNMTRVKGVDGTDPRSLSTGQIEAAGQINDIRRYLIDFVPGFEGSQLARTAPFLGIRETRRIAGQYVMTRDDILTCRRFDDAIAVASYPIDLHHPVDDDCTLEWCGDCYDLPYRSLLPQRVVNLLVAGRCISATHEAMAAIRVMATCMAMGEAAGRAARMAVREGVSPSDITLRRLREELIARGGYLRNQTATG